MAPPEKSYPLNATENRPLDILDAPPDLSNEKLEKSLKFQKSLREMGRFEYITRFFSAMPLIGVGAAVTVYALVRGIHAMGQGDSLKSQQMMRLRVAGQGFAVASIVGYSLHYKWRKRQAQNKSNHPASPSLPLFSLKENSLPPPF